MSVGCKLTTLLPLSSSSVSSSRLSSSHAPQWSRYISVVCGHNATDHPWPHGEHPRAQLAATRLLLPPPLDGRLLTLALSVSISYCRHSSLQSGVSPLHHYHPNACTGELRNEDGGYLPTFLDTSHAPARRAWPSWTCKPWPPLSRAQLPLCPISCHHGPVVGYSRSSSKEGIEKEEIDEGQNCHFSWPVHVVRSSQLATSAKMVRIQQMCSL